MADAPVVAWAPIADSEFGDRRARRRNRKINSILAMTALVIAERGYSNTSLDEIGERLDLAKPSLYHYFESKEALVYETLKTCASYVSGCLQQIANRDASASEKLRALIECQIRIITVDCPEMSRLFLHPVDWPTSIGSAMFEWRQEHDAIFRGVIAEGVSSGEFHVQDPAISRLCLQGALSFVPDWLREQDSEESRQMVVDTLMSLFAVNNAGI